jgi:hypothetical protein
MHLNDIGNIVEKEWTKTPLIRPDMNLTLGEFVVMPNHFRGIMIIGQNEFNTAAPPTNGWWWRRYRRDASRLYR